MQKTKNAEAMTVNLDKDLGPFELLDDQGEVVDLVQYRGKVVIVDFWAT